MTLSDNTQITYDNHQLVEVICQIRFPAILSIESNDPAGFQDLIRDSFPKYAVQVENIPQQSQQVKNHSFISRDGLYKLSLTKSFIALSTVKYTCWEDFAARLDEPLAQFINIYKPSFFERVGLRYINAFSRQKLLLGDCRWSELITSQYLGILNSPDINEGDVAKCSIDIERALDSHCKLKLHAGPGLIKRNIRSGNVVSSVSENEVRFILDNDLFLAANIDLRAVAESLNKLHDYADGIFTDTITDKLHKALNPVKRI